MSSAAINGWSEAADICWLLAFGSGFWNDRLARFAWQAHRHLAGNSEIETNDAAAQQAGRLVHLCETDQRVRRCILSFRERNGFSGLEGQIPTPLTHPSCRHQLRF